MKLIKKEITQVNISEKDIKNIPIGSCGTRIDLIIIEDLSQFDLSDKYPDFCKALFSWLNDGGLVVFKINNICWIYE